RDWGSSTHGPGTASTGRRPAPARAGRWPHPSRSLGSPGRSRGPRACRLQAPSFLTLLAGKATRAPSDARPLRTHLSPVEARGRRLTLEAVALELQVVAVRVVDVELRAPRRAVARRAIVADPALVQHGH